MFNRLLLILGIVATTCVLAAACGGSSSGRKSSGAAGASVETTAVSTVTASGTKASIVVVTAGKPTEYDLRVSPSSVEHGTVIFKITNLGKLRHGFRINGHTSRLLPPHRSTTLTVVFTTPSKYAYADPCVANDLGDFQLGASCGGGELQVT